MTARTPRVLTEAQLADFWRDGYLIVDDLVDPDLIARMGQRADLIASGAADDVPQHYVQLERRFADGQTAVADRTTAVRKMYQLARRDPVLREHAFGAAVVDVIGDLLGTDDLKLYNDQLFMKPAFHGAAQHWHQDSQAWSNMFPMDLVTAWTAIDQATIANGCLWMAVGSHRWGMVPASHKDQIEALFDGEWPIEPVELRPGSVSFHHSLTYHSSRPNTTPRRRRGYATHYMRSRTWYDPAVRVRDDLLPFELIRGREFPGCA